MGISALHNLQFDFSYAHLNYSDKNYHMFYVNLMKKRGPYSDTEWNELEKEKKKLIEIDESD